MNSITIRRARASDGTTLLRLIDALADYEKLARPTRAARARLLRDGFGRNRRFTPLLASVDGKAAGYALYFETYSSFRALPTLYLEDVFVLPEYRKQRVGLALFRACVAEAARRKCGRMEWVVLDWNEIAIRFYDRLGATQLSTWLPYRLEDTQFKEVLKGD